MQRMFAVLVFLFSVEAFAQPTQSLWVRTLDFTEQVISDATVTLFIDQMEEAQGQTGTDGKVEFQVPRIPPGQNPPAYSATAQAAGHVSVNDTDLDYPNQGLTEDNPLDIFMPRVGAPRRPIDPGELSPTPFPTPTPVPTATFTIPLDRGFLDLTRAAGWTHAASTGGVWFRICVLGVNQPGALPAGWNLIAGTNLLGFFTRVGCTFTLFGGRDLNPGFSLVGYTLVDGTTAGQCSPGSTVTDVTALAAGPPTLPVVISVEGPNSGSCTSVVADITIRGPVGSVPLNAFIP